MPHPLFLTRAAAAAALIATTGAQAHDHHVLIQSGEFEYAPGPGSLEEGAEFAILNGNPGAEGVFAMRIRLPDGFHIAPHHHDQPEMVTVISGTFHIGMGEPADIESATALEAGGFFAFPPGMVHYAYAEGETVVQLNSTGPWSITYMRDEDDPRLR